MGIIFLLLAISVVMVCVIVIVFIWAVNHDQFDDLEGPGYRILADDDAPDTKSRDQSRL